VYLADQRDKPRKKPAVYLHRPLASGHQLESGKKGRERAPTAEPCAQCKHFLHATSLATATSGLRRPPRALLPVFSLNSRWLHKPHAQRQLLPVRFPHATTSTPPHLVDRVLHHQPRPTTTCPSLPVVRPPRLIAFCWVPSITCPARLAASAYSYSPPCRAWLPPCAAVNLRCKVLLKTKYDLIWGVKSFKKYIYVRPVYIITLVLYNSDTFRLVLQFQVFIIK